MNVQRAKPLWGDARASTGQRLSFIIVGLLLLSPSVSGQNLVDPSWCAVSSNSSAAHVSIGARDAVMAAGMKGKPEATRRTNSYKIQNVGNRGIGTGANLYSVTREREVGRTLADEVDRTMRVVTDPTVNGYIARLTQRIVCNSDARFPLSIQVIIDDEVNAFALPGGYLYVQTGLILQADNEAQLAGMIAHEIGHAAARHATREATRSKQWRSFPPLLLVSSLMSSKYSRGAELEADLLGLEYQYLSGYDPQEYIRFFEKTEDPMDKPSFIQRVFSSYPSTPERIKRARRDIQRYLPSKSQYTIDTAAFQQMKSRVRQLVDAVRSPKLSIQINSFNEIHP